MSKIISSAWLPHPVPAGCGRAGRQGEGRGPEGSSVTAAPHPQTPRSHRPHRVVKRHSASAHDGRGGPILTPPASLWAQESNWLNTRHFQSSENTRRNKMVLYPRTSRFWRGGGTGLMFSKPEWARQLGRASWRGHSSKRHTPPLHSGTCQLLLWARSLTSGRAQPLPGLASSESGVDPLQGSTAIPLAAGGAALRSALCGFPAARRRAHPRCECGMRGPESGSVSSGTDPRHGDRKPLEQSK